MSGETYTNAQAAEAVGISRQTLHSWIKARKVKVPRMRIRAGHAMRLWNEEDLARLRKVKSKIYGTGRTGRPRKRK